MAEGRIIKAISGFFDVKSSNSVYRCKARGVFRKNNIKPLVGDFVEFEGDNAGEGYILSVKSRRNQLVRPPVANIDQAIIVSSAIRPEFSPLLLDRLLVLIESKRIKPVILMTKKDLLTRQELETMMAYQMLYETIGYSVELLSAGILEDPAFLKGYFNDRVSVITGQSGVGKSSLLNAINPSLELKTDDISESLGRGKHTTRHVELVQAGDGLAADTPGFSALDFGNMTEDELGASFPEIDERRPACKFRGCLHNKEPKCAVKQAVEDGGIAASRYHHYLRFLDDIHSRKMRY